MTTSHADKRRWLARPSGFRVTELAMLAGFAVLLVRNAVVYPYIAGVDAIEHRTRAWDLVVNGQLGTTGSYYTPPGWYAIAGELMHRADELDLADVEQPAQLFSAALVVASAVLLLTLVGRLFPGRPWLRLWALAAFCACPAVVKPAAMVHPQPLVLFLTLLALVLLVRLLARPQWGLAAAAALGLVLGSAQLVRSVGLWIYVATAGAFVLAFAVRAVARRRVALVAGIVLALGLLVPLPWYAYLQVEYGDPVFGGRPEIREGIDPTEIVLATAGPVPAPPPALRAPLSYFTATGLPESVSEPYRGALAPAFVPVLLADTWGDYLGQWRWGIPDAATDPPTVNRLRVQAVAGILLTFVSLTGLVALAVLTGRDPRRRLATVPLVLLPLLAVGSLALYAWRYPAADGDTVKGLFLLPAAPAFAVAFGFAVDVARTTLPRIVTLGGATLLAAALLVCVEFGIA